MSSTTAEPKTKGLEFLRRAVASQRNKKNKYLCIPMSKADEVIQEANGEFCIPLNPKSNTARAVAFMLGIEVSELCERMNGKTPKEYMSDIAELRNNLKYLESAGDDMSHGVTSGSALAKWAKAKAGIR